jgi:N-acetylneuraminic acid mutarotase
MMRLLLLLFLTFSFQSSAEQWVKRADLPGVGRHRACAAGIVNKGYMGTGHFNGTGVETYLADWWEFDPATNSWTQRADYPGNAGNGDCGNHAWVYNNAVYVGLGENQHRQLFKYNPLTNTWQAMTLAPSGINFQDTQEMVVDNMAYFSSVSNGTLYSYNCDTDSWANVGPLPISWNYTFSAFTYDNKCFVKANQTMYMYDPVINTWYQVVSAGLFPGLALRGSAEFFVNDKFYVVGGHGGTFGSVTDEVWEFDPVAYTWTQLDDFTGTARRYTKAFVINGRAYLGTGTNGTNFSDFWEFNKYLGLDEWDKDIEISIYPNPAEEFVCIKSQNEQSFSIRLMDALGKTMATDKTTNGKITVSLDQFPSGTYLICITIKGQEEMMKVVRR